MPPSETMFTTRPSPLRCSSGSNRCVSNNGANRFNSSSPRIDSGVRCSNGVVPTMPALLTNSCNCPGPHLRSRNFTLKKFKDLAFNYTAIHLITLRGVTRLANCGAVRDMIAPSLGKGDDMVNTNIMLMTCGQNTRLRIACVSTVKTFTFSGQSVLIYVS